MICLGSFLLGHLFVFEPGALDDAEHLMFLVLLFKKLSISELSTGILSKEQVGETSGFIVRKTL